MANNMDEFDQDTFETEAQGGAQGGAKKSVAQAWQSQPMVKLGMIMGVVGLAIAGALGAFSGPATPETPSRVVAPPALNEPPGGKSSPYFLEQNKQANEQRANQALELGGSSIPTPAGQNVDMDLLNKKDPMLEFRAETERLKQEMKAQQQINAQQIQALQQTQRVEPQDDSLAQAMQKQMQQMMDVWAPSKMKLVNGTHKEPSAAEKALTVTPVSGVQSGMVDAEIQKEARTLVAAGTVNYGQLLTEANSDVPGPVLVQIASGPLAGGRAIGQFQTQNDYLVIQFNMVSYKGKDYSVNAIALDPNTTLAGMATEVDQRYFTRLILPAAGAFLSTFGQTMGQTPVKTTVGDGGVVVAEQAKKGTKEALYDSMGEMGKTASRFFEDRAEQIKPLVRVAVGTPMGIFFLTPVMDQTFQEMQKQQRQNQTLGGLMATGYQQGLSGAQAYQNAYNPAAYAVPQSQSGMMAPSYGAGIDTNNSGLTQVAPGVYAPNTRALAPTSYKTR